MGKTKYTRIYLLGLTTFITIGYTYGAQNTLVGEYLNNLRSTDSGQVGFILGEIFNTSGKIKQDYLDLPNGIVVNESSTSVTGVVMLEHSTGSTSLAKAPTSGIIKVMWDNLVGQIGNKQDEVIGAGTSIVNNDLVGSRVLVSDSNGKVAASTVTSNELWYLTGVTSNVQTQLNAKAPLSSPSLTGTPTAPTAAVGTNSTQIATTAYVKSQGYITAASLTGVSSVNTRTGAVTLTKSDVGLTNVDNTSDLNKPISTATQTALNGKVTGNAAITAGTATKITYDAKGLVTGGTSLVATDIPNLDWSKITSGKPTTLAGYEITDAATLAQLNAKADIPVGGVTTIMTGNLVATRVLVSDTNGKVGASSLIDLTELGYLDGLTSTIQTQLNGKIGGSGTSGYIGKFTSTSGIGNSVIFESSGNIGIGTSSPGSQLTVAGMIETSTGGIKFPDGSIQTTAATGGGGSANYTAGTYAIVGSYTNKTITSTSYTKTKEIRIDKAGTITTVFDLCTSSCTVSTDEFGGTVTYSSTTYGRVYKNGVAVGTARSKNTAGCIAYSQDFTVNAGDLIQIYAYGTPSTNYCSAFTQTGRGSIYTFSIKVGNPDVASISLE